jgi:hypothetical protein
MIMMTTTLVAMTTAAMGTAMLAARAAVLDVACLSTRATHKEVQGVHRAMKHSLQVVQRRAEGNVLLHQRNLHKKRGADLRTSP